MFLESFIGYIKDNFPEAGTVVLLILLGVVCGLCAWALILSYRDVNGTKS